MKKYLFCVWVVLAFVSQMSPVYAIPPPDFLFNIGAQIAQVFSILVLFFSAILAATKDFLGVIFARFKHKTLIWVGLGALVIGISLGGAYFYSDYRQEKAVKEWEESNSEAIGEEIAKNVPVNRDSEIPPDYSHKMPIDSEITVNNEDFEKLLKSDPNIFILDAREDEEYEIGHMPGSTHIRFADLLAGMWGDLPEDQEIYVLCWSGIRGKEVTEFLRSKAVNARYIEEGADGWVADGGVWDGEIKFSKVYGDARYNEMLSKTEFEKEVENGAFIVDSRVQENYLKSHMEGSINLPLIYTPSKDIEKLLDSVPEGKSVITICDGWVSCFDAKMTGIKLEKKGHKFIGRYNNAI